MPKLITCNYFDCPYLGGAVIDCDCGHRLKEVDLDCSDPDEYVECPKCGKKIIGKNKVWVENKKKVLENDKNSSIKLV